MEEEELERRDEDTPAEAEEVEEGAMDSEEAHRFEEFEELREILLSMRESIEAMRSEMAQERQNAAAVAVENGEVVDEGEPAPAFDPDEYEEEDIDFAPNKGDEIDLSL